MTELSKYHTSCRDCSFADYDEDTQVGCLFHNRVENYRQKGMVVEAEDEEKKFFIVNSLCFAYQHQKQITPELVKLSEESVRVLMDAVIVIDESFNEQEFENTIRSIEQQHKPFHCVYVAFAKGVANRARVSTILRKSEIAAWVVSEIFEPSQKYLKDSILEELLTKIKSSFYSVFRSGYVIPHDFVSEVDDMINVEMLRPVIVMPYPDGEGETVNTQLRKMDVQTDVDGDFFERVMSVVDKDSEVVVCRK